jgi:hypothetical protein
MPGQAAVLIAKIQNDAVTVTAQFDPVIPPDSGADGEK